MRPFLKWAGNKYNCLAQLLENFPKAERLIEPFAGSAAITFNTNYPKYLLGEQNKDLISLFEQIKTEGLPFIRYCKSYFSSKNNSEEQYYRFRAKFNDSADKRERAALFLYLNRHGYNGLCRYNLKGLYNVPFGRYVKPFFPHEALAFFLDKCQNIELNHGDFMSTFAKAKKADLIYCDPPYAPIVQTSNFTNYAGNKFGESEQIILAKMAKETAQKGITVIISNHDTPFTRDLYKEANIKSFYVRRTINSNKDGRAAVKELLAIFNN